METRELFAFIGMFLFVIIVMVIVKLLNKGTKKDVYKRMNEVCSQLQQYGIEASIVKGMYLEKIGKEIKGTDWHHIYDTICDIRGQDIDYIIYIIITGRRQSDNYLDYVVIGDKPDLEGPKKGRADNLPRVQLSMKKDKGLIGRVTGINWTGGDTLSAKLNSDSGLNEKLLQRIHSNKDLKDTYVYYDKEYGYATIRTGALTPNAEDFEILNTIARHIKSAWFGR